MLKSHKRLIDKIDTTAMKRGRVKNKKNNSEETKQKCRLGTASDEITGGGRVEGGLHLVCGRPTLAFCSAVAAQTLSYLVCVEDS